MDGSAQKEKGELTQVARLPDCSSLFAWNEDMTTVHGTARTIYRAIGESNIPLTSPPAPAPAYTRNGTGPVRSQHKRNWPCRGLRHRELIARQN